MTLGEKIKKARLDAGMTQSALAGEFITRNMLSQIENGNATPSVQTIQYISDKLNVPAGYFISEKNDDFFYKKQSLIDEIHTLFREKKYIDCVKLCRDLGGSDDEIAYIITSCFYHIGRKYFSDGNIAQASDAFEKLLAYADKTLYSTQGFTSSATVILSLIGSIEPKLKKKKLESLNISKLLAEADAIIYFSILNDISAGKKRDVKAVYESGMIKNENYIKHIKAINDMQNSDYEKAFEELSSIDLESLSPVLQYKILNDLEICSRRNSDFQNAYICSAKKLELFQSMHDSMI